MINTYILHNKRNLEMHWLSNDCHHTGYVKSLDGMIEIAKKEMNVYVTCVPPGNIEDEYHFVFICNLYNERTKT